MQSKAQGDTYLDGWLAHAFGLDADLNPYDSQTQSRSYSRWYQGWYNRYSIVRCGGLPDDEIEE